VIGETVERKPNAAAQERPKESFRLSITRHLDSLLTLREWLAQTMQSHPSERQKNDLIFHLQLAVQEAAANIILHTALSGSGGEIDVTICIYESAVEIQFIYDGPAFDSTMVAPPDFDGSRTSGFGLFIIQELMDEVEYRRTADHKNFVRLKRFVDERSRKLMIAIEEDVSGATVVQLTAGALDAKTSKAFRDEIKETLQGKKQVVLDLSQTTFVDSSGLGILIACLKKVSATGGDMKLCGLNDQVRALFELVRMHRIFSIYNSRDEAVRAFR